MNQSPSRQLLIRLSPEAYARVQQMRGGKKHGISKIIESWLWRYIGSEEERARLQHERPAEQGQA